MNHLEVRQKYSAALRTFNSILSVSSGDETLCLMVDILLEWRFQASFPVTLIGKNDKKNLWSRFAHTLENEFINVMTKFLFKDHFVHYFTQSQFTQKLGRNLVIYILPLKKDNTIIQLLIQLQ